MIDRKSKWMGIAIVVWLCATATAIAETVNTEEQAEAARWLGRGRSMTPGTVPGRQA